MMPLSAASGLTTEFAHRHFRLPSSTPSNVPLASASTPQPCWEQTVAKVVSCWAAIDRALRVHVFAKHSGIHQCRVRHCTSLRIEMLHPPTPAATTREPGTRAIRCRDAADSSAAANRSTWRRGSWILSRASMIRHSPNESNDRTLPHNLPFFRAAPCGGSSPSPINRLSKSSLCHGSLPWTECQY